MPTITRSPMLHYVIGSITLQDAGRIIEMNIRAQTGVQRALKLEARIREAEREIRTARDNTRLMRVQAKRLEQV